MSNFVQTLKRVFKRTPKEKDYDTATLLTKHRGKDKPLFIVVFIIILIHCLTLLMPVLWMFMSSFKEGWEYFLESKFSLPEVWHFDNYAKAFKVLGDPTTETTFFGLVFNSVWYTLLATGSTLLMPAAVGYIFAKYDFPGKNALYAVIIFSLTIPIVGSQAAGLKLLNALGLYDNPVKFIVNIAGGFTGTFLVYHGFFRSLSGFYAEAAEIDGAGPFTIFFRIILPQAVPIMMTYAITTGIAQWNDYMSVIMYFPSYPTLASGLFKFKSNLGRDNYPVYYAGLIISMIPTIVLFAAFSDKIMTSISVGGIKG